MTVLVSLWRHPEASGKVRPTVLVSTWVDRVEQLWRTDAVRSAGLTTGAGINTQQRGKYHGKV